jgi:hypothetical protein
MTVAEAAISYAARGWPVLPLYGIVAGRCGCAQPACSSPGKHPAGNLVPNGLKQASTDQVLITRWFADSTLNCGVATGSASGVWVLDIDGADGWRSLKQYEAAQGSLPKTVRSETGNGGHFFFEARGPVASAVRLMPGIDVRGDHAYAVVPPSEHLSRSYRWHEGHAPWEVPLATAPEALFIRWPAQIETTPKRTLTTTGRPISEGVRNDTLFRRASAMQGKGRTLDAIEAELQAVNLAQCEPPLPQDEVARIARSASQYPPNADRALTAVLEAHETAPSETLAERAARPTTDRRPWIVEGLIDATTLSELVGRRKVGKTTFTLDLIAAVTTGTPFLNRRTRRAKVVYLTEETGKVLDASLARAGLTGSPDVKLIERNQEPWASLAKRVVGICADWGAELLVIDSLTAFAVPADEEENSVGWAARSLAPLLAAQGKGLTVFIVLHARKERGDEQARGSSRLSHDADNIFTLVRRTNERAGRVRLLHYEGRFQEPVAGHYERAVPRTIQVRLGPRAYIDDAAEQSAADRVLEALTAGPTTIREIQKLTALRRSDALAAMADLFSREKLIDRTGAGRKGDPFLYFLPNTVPGKRREPHGN